MFDAVILVKFDSLCASVFPLVEFVLIDFCLLSRVSINHVAYPNIVAFLWKTSPMCISRLPRS